MIVKIGYVHRCLATFNILLSEIVDASCQSNSLFVHRSGPFDILLSLCIICKLILSTNTTDRHDIAELLWCFLSKQHFLRHYVLSPIFIIRQYPQSYSTFYFHYLLFASLSSSWITYFSLKKSSQRGLSKSVNRRKTDHIMTKKKEALKDKEGSTPDIKIE
jgi:hypothetical protein